MGIIDQQQNANQKRLDPFVATKVAEGLHFSSDSGTCSPERATGPPLGCTAGEVFCVEALEGVCDCGGCGVALTAGVTSEAPFSGVLCTERGRR